MLGAGLYAGQSCAAEQSAVLDSESMHRPVSSIFSAFFALFGLACSEEPPPGFEEGTFGAAHREEIEDFCDRRVMCAARTNPYLRSDAFDDCVTQYAQRFNTMEMARFKWSLGIKRCFQEDPCQYRDCVDSTYQSWGESQLLKIQNICAQTKQCLTETGMLAVSPQVFDETCQINSVLAADMLTGDLRTAYQDTYFQCQAQVSCAFDMCFPY
jgi:hypothetical protein